MGSWWEHNGTISLFIRQLSLMSFPLATLLFTQKRPFMNPRSGVNIFMDMNESDGLGGDAGAGVRICVGLGIMPERGLRRRISSWRKSDLLLWFYSLTLHYLVVFVPLEGSGGRVIRGSSYLATYL